MLFLYQLARSGTTLPCLPTYLIRTSLAALVASAGLAHGQVPSENFSVNTQDRLAVLSFYHKIYLASEGSASVMGWTGSITACIEGTTSPAYREMVKRRVNYYRAMAGLPSVTFDATPAYIPSWDPVKPPAGTSKFACAQRAALMMTAHHPNKPSNATISHTPPPTWTCYTPAGYNGAAHGNLALGYLGPAAVDAYMYEDGGTNGEANKEVGHRRWILYSRATDMSSGDIPGNATYFDSNCLYVIGQELSPAPAPKFIKWPPGGYSPISLAPKRWSLSYPGANFASALVSMTDSQGNSIPVTVDSKTVTDSGDNTIAWTPTGIPTTTTNDLTYNVTVLGIGGAGSSVHSYQVKLVNPYVLGIPLSISGSSLIPLTGGYFNVTILPEADEHLATTYRQSFETWNEGGEDATAAFVLDQTTSGAPLREGAGGSGSSAFSPRTGSKSLHLTFVSGDPSTQVFELNRDLYVTNAQAKLTFYNRWRWSTTGTWLEVQASENNGSSWNTIWEAASPGVSTSTALSTNGWLLREASLANYVGKIVRLRFRLVRRTGSYFGYAAGFPITSYGTFVDDIQAVNATLAVSPNSFPITSATPFVGPGSVTGGWQNGQSYLLNYRVRMGPSFLAASPVHQFTISSGVSTYSTWEMAIPNNNSPGTHGDSDQDGICNLLEYALGLNPTLRNSHSSIPQPTISNSTMSLTVSQPPNVSGIRYGAEFSCDMVNWAPLEAHPAGALHTFTKNIRGLNCGFIRLRISLVP